MMCLGWDNNPICKPAPDTVIITAPAITPEAVQVITSGGDPLPYGTLCPDITWFWIASALVAGGALLKGMSR